MGQRTDIQGLRAIAVVTVVLFHFSVPGFAGGFVGVDVFFVISGFLMTQIILSRLDENRFSLLDFYLQRARRIWPALLATCMAVLVYGYLRLLPLDFALLGKHAARAALFVSNHVFYNETGYFDARSREKWLLHTWSLSTEWQFYILYPILLAALLGARRPSRLAWILTAIGVASFAGAVYASTQAPSFGFYLLPARIWEMLAGALVALVPRPSERLVTPLEIVGLALILLGVVCFGPLDPWPGWRAAIPVAGTALVIAAANPRSLIGGRVPTWIGDRSYSVYLWHWPLVVGIVDWTGTESPGWAWILGGIVASFAIGELSFRTIETGTRRIWTRPAQSGPRADLRLILRVAAAPVLIAVIGTGLWFARGLPGRFTSEVLAAEAERNNSNRATAECFGEGPVRPPCRFGNAPGSPRADVLLRGDSHAVMIASALATALPSSLSGGVSLAVYPTCPMLARIVPLVLTSRCAEFQARYFPEMRDPRDERPLVIAEFWTRYVEPGTVAYREPDGSLHDADMNHFRSSVLSTFCGFAKTRPTYVMLPIPRFTSAVPKIVARALAADPNAADPSVPVSAHVEEYGGVIAVLRMAAEACGVRLLDPIPYLCPDGRCLLSQNRIPLYYDDNHLSEHGNRLLVPMFAPVFREPR